MPLQDDAGGRQIAPSPDPSVTPQPHAVNDPSSAGTHTLTYWAQDV